MSNTQINATTLYAHGVSMQIVIIELKIFHNLQNRRRKYVPVRHLL